MKERIVNIEGVWHYDLECKSVQKDDLHPST
jgi:hypothetical protein